jgi:YVTN family beta-propeller protein
MLQPHLFKRFACFFAAGAVLLTACDPKENATPAGKYENGVLIVHEGSFNNGTGTISYFNRTGKTVENDIFEATNARPLGNLLQSVSIHNGKAYAVVNNANKIEVADAKDFKSVGVINGLAQPRYFLGINEGKAYVSQWGADGLTGSVVVVDLNTNAVTRTIATGRGAERMLRVNNNVYVTWEGGYGNDNRVTVLDANTDAVVANIPVGDAPNSLQLDANNKIWVLCGGIRDFNNSTLNTTSSLVRINPASNTVELTSPFNDLDEVPEELTINKARNALFYLYSGGVYRHDISSSALSPTPFIYRYIYGLGIDPADDVLYAADAGDFISNGKVIRYNPTTGVALDSVQVGIIPSEFTFR